MRQDRFAYPVVGTFGEAWPSEWPPQDPAFVVQRLLAGRTCDRCYYRSGAGKGGGCGHNSTPVGRPAENTCPFWQKGLV